MTERNVTHATFTLRRSFSASPARVFRAFSDMREKAKWFGDAADGVEEHTMDFRVGGREHNHGKEPHGGGTYVFDLIYQDIIPDQRIVYTYDMLINGSRISVSLGTLELRPEGKGTILVYTEQGAYLDGYDNPKQRELGTVELFDKLATTLKD